MIYITQIIFINEGEEEVFHKFEKLLIPIIEEYNGKLIYRIRPTDDSFINCLGERPYEIHLVSFTTDLDFIDYKMDKRRKEFLHLKEGSIRYNLMIQGERI